jgi:hypothetical protein
MRIGLISNGFEVPCKDIEQYYIGAGATRLLCHESVYPFRPSDMEKLVSQKLDRVILTGSVLQEDARWDLLLNSGIPIFTLGIDACSNLSDLSKELLRQCLKTTGLISASDNASAAKIDRFLGTSSAFASGTPATALEVAPFSQAEPHTLLDGTGPISLLSTMQSTQSTMVLVHSRHQLSSGIGPGPSTLFAPNTPEFQAKCLSSAGLVISESLIPLVVAARNGTKVCLLVHGENTSDSKRYGIPSVAQGTTPEETLARVHSALRGFSLTYTQQKIREVFDEISTQLNRQRVRMKRSSALISEKGGKPNLTYATIADRNFIPLLVGQLENLLTISGSTLDVHVLALDEEVTNFFKYKYRDIQIQCTTLSELWPEKILKRILSRSTAQKAYTAKPRFLRFVQEKTQKTVFFFDTDIYFFDSPLPLYEAFGDGNTLLFPHWNDSFQKTREYGIFNSGIVGVKGGSELFLKWWENLCVQNCRVSREEGLYYEQVYLDEAPVIFPDVRIYRAGDHNVGHWNIDTLGGSISSGVAFVDGGRIRSFHSAAPDKLGLHECKAAWDQAASFFSHPRPEILASPPLYEEIFAQQRAYWPELDLALKAHHVWASRLGIPLNFFSSRTVRLLEKKWVKRSLLLTASAYRFMRSLARRVFFRPKRKSPSPSSTWAQNRRRARAQLRDLNLQKPLGSLNYTRTAPQEGSI